MDLQFHIDEKRFLPLRRLLRRFDQLEAIEENATPNQWFYFRRSHPVKIEVYNGEDFQYKYQPDPLEEALNHSTDFSKQIRQYSNDLLCIKLDDTWQEFVRFENQWVRKPDNEHTSWRHRLLARGRVVSR